jgi:hypothetical protein
MIITLEIAFEHIDFFALYITSESCNQTEKCWTVYNIKRKWLLHSETCQFYKSAIVLKKYVLHIGGLYT